MVVAEYVLAIGELTINRHSQVVERWQSVTSLSNLHYQIFLAIAESHPKPLSRSDLMTKVWGAEPPESDALRSHIFQIRKQLEIECEIEPGSTLNADAQSLQIIIENLVQNAVRYTEQGGIKINARNAVFEIKDSGCGFDFQHAKQQGVKAKNSSGFGIGLSLVERLCGVNGLRLEVESSAEGSCIALKSR